MQSKLLFLLFACAPAFAQEAPAVANQTEAPKSETSKTDQVVNQKEQPATVAFNATKLCVEFHLIKEIESVDKTVWQNLKKSVRECAQLIKDKQFEQAGAALDAIKNSKPEGVVTSFVVSADTDNTLIHAQINYATAITRAIRGQCKCVLCEVNKTTVSPETWKSALDVVFGAMRSNQELSYDQAKQLAFVIISKVN